MPSDSFRPLPYLCVSIICFVTTLLAGHARSALSSAFLTPIPAEVRSTHFVVSVNGQRTPVMHAATGNYALNFNIKGAADISVTAESQHYWDKGVEIQPLRLGFAQSATPVDTACGSSEIQKGIADAFSGAGGPPQLL